MKAKLKTITAEMIYVSVLKARMETVDGQKQWVPVSKTPAPTGCYLMDALAMILAKQSYLKLQQFAWDLEVNKDDLAGAIHIFTRLNTIEFIRQYRLMQVKEYLTCTDLTLDQIAIRCGLRRKEQLIHYFRTTEHDTPSAYRKAYRPKDFRERYRWE